MNENQIEAIMAFFVDLFGTNNVHIIGSYFYQLGKYIDPPVMENFNNLNLILYLPYVQEKKWSVVREWMTQEGKEHIDISTQDENFSTYLESWFSSYNFRQWFCDMGGPFITHARLNNYNQYEDENTKPKINIVIDEKIDILCYFDRKKFEDVLNEHVEIENWLCNNREKAQFSYHLKTLGVPGALLYQGWKKMRNEEIAKHLVFP